jgi:hypothetical protein
MTEERAQKTRRPLVVRPRAEGGRWPGPYVVRDGERCYRWPRAGYYPSGHEQHTATGGLEVREAAHRYCALYPSYGGPGGLVQSRRAHFRINGMQLEPRVNPFDR